MWSEPDFDPNFGLSGRVCSQGKKTGPIGSGWPQIRFKFGFNPIMKLIWIQFWIGLGPQGPNLGWVGSSWAQWGQTLYLIGSPHVFTNFFSQIVLKQRFFKNRKLYWSNVPQNSNLGRENFVQKSGIQIPVGRIKFFVIFLFFFTFYILSIKNWILKHKLLFLYINRLHRNKIKFVQYT